MNSISWSYKWDFGEFLYGVFVVNYLLWVIYEIIVPNNGFMGRNKTKLKWGDIVDPKRAHVQEWMNCPWLILRNWPNSIQLTFPPSRWKYIGFFREYMAQCSSFPQCLQLISFFVNYFLSKLDRYVEAFGFGTAGDVENEICV